MSEFLAGRNLGFNRGYAHADLNDLLILPLPISSSTGDFNASYRPAFPCPTACLGPLTTRSIGVRDRTPWSRECVGFPDPPDDERTRLRLATVDKTVGTVDDWNCSGKPSITPWQRQSPGDHGTDHAEDSPHPLGVGGCGPPPCGSGDRAGVRRDRVRRVRPQPRHPGVHQPALPAALFQDLHRDGQPDAGGARLAVRQAGPARSGRSAPTGARQAQHRSADQAPGATPSGHHDLHALPARRDHLVAHRQGTALDAAGDRRHRLRRACPVALPQLRPLLRRDRRDPRPPGGAWGALGEGHRLRHPDRPGHLTSEG